MNSGKGKVGSMVNWDKEEQKVCEIIFELFIIVCLTWLRVPTVDLVYLIPTFKSINSSSFGSALLQVLM